MSSAQTPVQSPASSPAPGVPDDPVFRTQLHALMVGGFCSGASARVCDAMLPQLATDFATDISTVSQVVSSFALAYGLTQLFFGPLGDRYGKIRVIFFACLMAGLGAAACALAGNLQGLTWVRFFAGGMAAGVIPMTIAWIGDSVPYEDRQPVMAKFLFGTLSGLIMGQILGGLASDTMGWRSAFWIIAAMYGLSAMRLRPHSKYIGGRVPGPGSSWWQASFHGYVRVLMRPYSALVLPVVMLEGFVVFSALAFIPSMIHHREGVSLSMASCAVAGFGLGGLIYAWRSKSWLARMGEKGFTRIGGSLFGLGMLAMIMVPGFLVSLISCFAAGIGFYMLHNTLQTLGSQISPDARGSAMALFALVLFVGQTFGVMAAAWIVGRWGYPPVFVISAFGAAMLGFFIASQLRRLDLS